jgi:hypothetical protein
MLLGTSRGSPNATRGRHGWLTRCACAGRRGWPGIDLFLAHRASPAGSRKLAQDIHDGALDTDLGPHGVDAAERALMTHCDIAVDAVFKS